MPELYPPIEPYACGLMDVGNGHRSYWEECGNPDGKPALVIHGGPGSGAVLGWRRYFDPDRYRLILFDQHGCAVTSRSPNERNRRRRPTAVTHGPHGDRPDRQPVVAVLIRV
jgi:proline iminopeptidase